MEIDISKKVRVWWDGGEVIGYLENTEYFNEADDIYYNWYDSYPCKIPHWNYYMTLDVRSVNGSLVSIDTRTIKEFKISNI